MNHNVKWIMAILVIAGLTVWSISNVSSQEVSHTIKVSGSASKIVKPDQVIIHFNKEARYSNFTNIINVHTLINNITNAVISIEGIDANNTSISSNIFIHPDYRFSKPVSDNLTAVINLYIEGVSIDRYDMLVKNLTDYGVFINNISLERRFGPEFYVYVMGELSITADTLQELVEISETKLAELDNILEGINYNADLDIIERNLSRDVSLYIANIRTTVKVDQEYAEAVNEVMKRFKFNPENISFAISNTKIDEVREELYDKAVEDAKSKAEKIAERMGLQLGEIKSIDFSNNIDDRGMIIFPEQFFEEVVVSVDVEFVAHS